MKLFKFLLVANPIKTFLLLAVAFALLLVGVLVPLLFTERTFLHNKFGYLMDGATTLDSTTESLLFKFPTIQITWKYGVIFYCKNIEFIFQDGIHSAHDISQVSSSLSGKSGTFCDFLPFGLNVDSTTDFDSLYYNTAIVNNSVTIVGEMDASVGGFPGGGPIGGGGPNDGGHGGLGGSIPIYTSFGKSAFFHFVNPHVFDALRVFLIIALIVTALALIVALILAIIHCSSCKVALVHSHSGTAHLQHLLHWLLFVLVILWIIIIILLIVVYNQVIHGLFNNSKWSNIFAIAVSFWLLWVAYVLTLAAFLLTKKIHFMHPHAAGAMQEMASVETPVSYADYKFGPSMTAATPSAPPAQAHSHGVVASSFV